MSKRLQVVDENYVARGPEVQDSATLKSGDGGDNSGGMEARLAKLEAHMEHVLADTGGLKGDVGKLKTDVATLTERVAHLPSKGFIVRALGIGLGLLAALTLFGPNIRAIFSLS